MRKQAVALLSFGLLAAPASAQSLPRDETKTIVAPAGERSGVETLSAVDGHTCQSSVPAISVTQRPAHGVVDVVARDGVLHRTLDADAQHCIGMATHAARVYYTPAAGFHGADRFAFTAVLHAGVVTRTIIVTVP